MRKLNKKIEKIVELCISLCPNGSIKVDSDDLILYFYKDEDYDINGGIFNLVDIIVYKNFKLVGDLLGVCVDDGELERRLEKIFNYNFSDLTKEYEPFKGLI